MAVPGTRFTYFSDVVQSGDAQSPSRLRGISNLPHKYVNTRLQSPQNCIHHSLRDPDIPNSEMKTAVIFVLFFVALSLAVPLENVARVRREEKDKGGVDVDVHREKGVGTVVGVKAEGNLWSSNDGNTRLDAQGDWSRVYNGPGKGKPNYNAGIHFSHRF